MRQIAILLWVVSAVMVLPSRGQTLADRLSSMDFEVEGLRFYGVTAFTSYSTSAFPLTSAGASGVAPLAVPGAAELGAAVSYGLTASAGWHYSHERTHISVFYSANYTGNSAYSSLNAFGDHLSISARRSLTPKLQFSLSASGSDTTFAQFVFAPTTALTQSSSSLDDLAATGSAGQFTSTQAADTLSGSPALESPNTVTLLGNHVLSYSGQATLTYSVSQRLHFSFGSVSAGGQHVGGNVAGQQPYSMPHTLGLNASASFSYALTPRTTIGVTAGENRVQNSVQKDYLTSASASIGRKMGPHWFMSAHGGGSISQAESQSYGTPKARNVIGGGQIGFRMTQSTLAAAFNRSSYDDYGFAVGTVSIYSATWFFHPMAGHWTFFTTFAEQQIRNTGFLSLSGWQTSGGVSRNLSSHVVMTSQYSYMSSAGTYLGIPSNFGVSSVRVSMSFRPQGMGMMSGGASSPVH
jgi:hypothetical protein